MNGVPALDLRRASERAAQTRLMLAHETALEAHLIGVLRRAGQVAARGYRDGGLDHTLTVLQPVAAELHHVLRRSLGGTARAFAHRLIAGPKSWAWVERKTAFDILDAAIAAWLDRHAAQRVVGITQALRQSIAATVTQGLADEVGETVLAQRIVEATTADMVTFRARRIARTETHTASQVGQHAAAEASPLAFEKEWLATEDSRTRPDHDAANGQRVALEDKFVVGGHQLAFPGDPEGAPSQTIQCRCVTAMHPIPRSQRV